LETLLKKALQKELAHFYEEDDLSRNGHYLLSLPMDKVLCTLNFKEEMVIAGLPFLVEAFNYLGADLNYSQFAHLEGKSVKKTSFDFHLPFAYALTGERLALNLLARSSSIATATNRFVKKAEPFGIAILDTRKTTPGLRLLEKYAVVKGGGYNHRLGQLDLFMIKDNHKIFFGGVKEAVEFFRSQHGFYTPIEVEVHTLSEIKEAASFGVKHLMLDNFSPEQVKKAIEEKPEGVTYEVSGGIKIDTIDDYLMKGVDAISIGSLTNGAPNVDISLKYKKV